MIRGDTQFSAYLFDPESHHFSDLNQIYDAECVIDSVNIAKISATGKGIFLKCEGPGPSVVKAYEFVKDVHEDTWTFKHMPNKRFMSESQPFIADFNGDFMPDILFTNGIIQIAFQTKNPHEFIIKPFDDFLLQMHNNHQCLQQSSNRKIALPSTTVYTDFDGDCIPDLLLITEESGSNTHTVEVYHQAPLDPLQPKESQLIPRLCLVKKSNMPAGVSSMASIQDYDNDGMVDLMSHGEKEIYIFWNSLESATNKEKTLCKTEKEVMANVGSIFAGLDSSIHRSVIPVDLPDFKEFKTTLRSIPS